MANGFSAGDLYLNIGAVADDTLKKLDAVVERLNLINKGLGGITKTSKISQVTAGSSGGNKSDKSFGGFLKLSKWTAVLYSAKRLGNYMGKIVQYGADYTETLNLWETAMGSNLTVATEFVSKMNEAYGISEKTLMNAQAIFKNMLGSLGQISDTMAYSLSEGITQMALDYASLYNVTFEQAFTKFQAALAGQVRPIRSVAGYDITENTLFQLYQQLGGEKTMRQLSRTEKQLLSILAIFNQMEASGATGDLRDTMESFANQSRVMAEGWQRTMTYSGVILTHLIEQSGVMTYLNAVLIFLGDTLKAVAESMGAIKSFADPFESTTEGALDASEAIDEVTGKLLGFDKFRALNTADKDSGVALDQKLLEALASFDSILGSASMEAKKLAEQFKLASGLFDENGVFNKDRWDEITQSVEDLGKALLIVFGAKTVTKILDFISKVDLATFSIDLFDLAVKGMALYFFAEAIKAFEDGDYALGILSATIGVCTLALWSLNKESLKLVLAKVFANIANVAKTALAPALALVAGYFAGFSIWDSYLSGLEGHAKDVASSWAIVAGVLATVLGIILAIKGGVTGGLIGATVAGLGVGALVAGIKAQAEGAKFSLFADGGLPDKGTMFVAGEAGAEMVYNMPSGQSGVANIQQIAQATYNGTIRALNDWWGGSQARGDIPQLKEANPTGLYQAVTGVAKSQGFVWDRA